MSAAKIFTGYFLVGTATKYTDSYRKRYCPKNNNHNVNDPSNDYCSFCGSPTMFKEIEENYFNTMYSADLPEGVFPIYRDEGFGEVNEYLGVIGSTVDLIFDNDIKNVRIEVSNHGVTYDPIPDELIAAIKEAVKYSELRLEYGTICIPQ